MYTRAKRADDDCVTFCRRQHDEPQAYAQGARRTEPAEADAKPNEADGEPSPRGRLGRNRAVGTRGSPRNSGPSRNRRDEATAPAFVGFRSLRVLSVVARFGFSLESPSRFSLVPLGRSRHLQPSPGLPPLLPRLVPTRASPWPYSPLRLPCLLGLGSPASDWFCCFGWLGVRSGLRLGVHKCKFVIINYLGL